MIRLEDYRIIDFEGLLKKEDYAERQTFLWLNYLKSLGDFKAIKSSFETIVQELRDTDSLKQVLNQKNERRVDQATFKLFWHSKDSKINFDTPPALKKMERLKHIIVDKSTIELQDAIFQSAKMNAKGIHDKIEDLDSLKKELLVILNIVGHAALKKLNRSLDYYNLVDRIERDLFHQALFERYKTFYLENPPKSASDQLLISKAISLIEKEKPRQILNAFHEDTKYKEYVKIKKALEKAKVKGEQTTITFTFNKNKLVPLEAPLLIKDEKVYSNELRYFVGQSDRCK